MAELRDALEARGLDTKGTKPFLVERLTEALAAEAANGTEAPPDQATEAVAAAEADAPVEQEDPMELEDADQVAASALLLCQFFFVFWGVGSEFPKASIIFPLVLIYS